MTVLVTAASKHGATYEVAEALGSGVYMGRWLGLGARTVAHAVHAPEGDFRDWGEITAWADHIAEALTTA